MAIRTNGIVRCIYIRRPAILMAALMAACAVGVLDANTLDSVVIDAGQFYNQTTSASPTLVGYEFVGNYNADPLGSTFSPATLTCPATCGTLPVPYTDLDIGPAASIANTLQAFQNALPSGSYTFNLSTYTENVPYSNDPTSWLLPTAIPYATNFNDLQGMNPKLAFTVDFFGFTPNSSAASMAYTTMVIEPTLNPTVIAFQDTVLNTATSVVIPAGTLQSGVEYTYYLSYSGIEMCGNQTCPTGVTLDQEFSQNTFGNFTPIDSSPEPSTLFLFGVPAVGLAGFRRLRRDLGRSKL